MCEKRDIATSDRDQQGEPDREHFVSVQAVFTRKCSNFP